MVALRYTMPFPCVHLSEDTAVPRNDCGEEGGGAGRVEREYLVIDPHVLFYLLNGPDVRIRANEDVFDRRLFLINFLNGLFDNIASRLGR
jgi:hypothetical protein